MVYSRHCFYWLGMTANIALRLAPTIYSIAGHGHGALHETILTLFVSSVWGAI